MVAYDAIYIFSSKENLINLFASYPQFKPGLGKTFVLQVKEGGYGEATVPAKIVKFKLLFLALFWSVEINIKQENYQAILGKLTEKAYFDEETFDHWWTIERVPFSPKDLEFVFHHMAVDQLERIAETNIPRLDQWFAEVTEYKRDGKL